MTIEELITKLKEIASIHGNLPVVISIPEDENLYAHTSEITLDTMRLDVITAYNNQGGYTKIKALNLFYQ